MAESCELLWKKCLTFIRGNVDHDEFRKTFESVHVVEYDNDVLTLGVVDSYTKDQLVRIHEDVLRVSVDKFFGKEIRIAFHIVGKAATEDGDKTGYAPATSSRTDIVESLDPQLREDYDFSSFVEGEANKVALAMGKSIAANPKQDTLNPFFVFGPSGVGKTHLINAVGVALKERFPSLRVLYVTANVFKQQFIAAATMEANAEASGAKKNNNRKNDFIAFYQSIDVLILDDVQEITTTKTQETFFHIFDHLHRNKRHLILACDRPPVELKGFEDRLLSRFKWGVVIEMQRPDVDLRRNILFSKLKRNDISFPDDVVEYIARHVDDNVRNLEGVIDSLLAYSIVGNCDVNISLAESVVQRTINMSKREITPESIVEVVCKVLSLKAADVHSKKRKKEITQGRQIAMYLCSKLTSLGTVQIGRSIGKRDHSTVIHSCKMVRDQIDMNREFARLVENIEKAIHR